MLKFHSDIRAMGRFSDLVCYDLSLLRHRVEKILGGWVFVVDVTRGG